VQSDVLNLRFTNQGTIRINGGDLKNTGYFKNEGTVNFNRDARNYGTIHNTGTIRLACGGSLTNQATLTGNPPAVRLVLIRGAPGSPCRRVL
jgi:hypothetical protein